MLQTCEPLSGSIRECCPGCIYINDVIRKRGERRQITIAEGLLKQERVDEKARIAAGFVYQKSRKARLKRLNSGRNWSSSPGRVGLIDLRERYNFRSGGCILYSANWLGSGGTAGDPELEDCNFIR